MRSCCCQPSRSVLPDSCCPPAARWSPPKTGPSRSRYTRGHARPVVRDPDPARWHDCNPTGSPGFGSVNSATPGNVRDEVHLPILAERKHCASLRFRNATRRQHNPAPSEIPKQQSPHAFPQMISYPDSFPFLLQLTCLLFPGCRKNKACLVYPHVSVRVHTDSQRSHRRCERITCTGNHRQVNLPTRRERSPGMKSFEEGVWRMLFRDSDGSRIGVGDG